MRSILVNIGLVPVLFVAVPLVIMLSCAPSAGRGQRFRRRVLDWLDRVTNDYGAELIYLPDPSGAEVVTEPARDTCPIAVNDGTAETKLIMFPRPGAALRDPTTPIR
jgi:hypothetical protein